MKSIGSLLLAILIVSGTAQAAVVYSDTTGDVAVGDHPHLDITSVAVSNTDTTISFQIYLAGNPVATDWGKYMIGISTAPGGDTGGNGWGRPITMSDGMEHWIGSWVDGGNGAQLWDYTGSWVQDSVTGGTNPANLSISKDSSSVTITVDMAALGLSVNSAMYFDVYSSSGGSGDGATDSLAAASTSISNWGDSFNTSANGGSPNPALAYSVVPEPAVALLGGLGLLGLLRRRR